MTVYSTKTCGKCMMLKNILKGKNISFENKFYEDCEDEAKSLNISTFPTVIDNEGNRYEGASALQFANKLK